MLFKKSLWRCFVLLLIKCLPSLTLSTSDYCSSISPAYKVMSRMAVNPVNIPAFWIMKKVKSVFLPVTFSLSMSFISGN